VHESAEDPVSYTGNRVDKLVTVALELIILQLPERLPKSRMDTHGSEAAVCLEPFCPL
jgi:hypothetical protein